jgi:hypothetical protein
MAEIFDFPGADERAWRERSAPIGNELRRQGFSAEAIEWILGEWWRRTVAQVPPSAKLESPENAREIIASLIGGILLAVVDLLQSAARRVGAAVGAEDGRADPPPDPRRCW